MMPRIKKMNSNRTFGLVFSFVFLLFAFWSFRGDFGQIKKIPLFISIFFLILGLMNSKLLTPLNFAWIKFGQIIGKMISPIIMGIVYFIVLTPISFILRMFGKDLLKIKFSKNGTYWIKRKKSSTSMKKQF